MLGVISVLHHYVGSRDQMQVVMIHQSQEPLLAGPSVALI